MTLLRDPKQIESQLELPARHIRPRRVHWIAWALSLLVIGLGVIAVALTTADDGASAEAVRRTDFAAPELIPSFAEYATTADLASTVNPLG